MSSSLDRPQESAPGPADAEAAAEAAARPDVFARLEAESERRAADAAGPSSENDFDPLAALIARIDSELAGVEDPIAPARSAAGAIEIEQVLRFSLGEEIYAVPAGQLVELAPVPELTFVPGVARECGLANYRGEIIAVTDLGARAAGRPSTDRRMIVVDGGRDRGAMGAIVDASLGFVPWHRDAEGEDPERERSTLPSAPSRFQLGRAVVGGREIPVLDLAAWVRSSDQRPPGEGRP